MPDLQEKQCFGCKAVKSLTEFYANRKTKIGYSSRCKECIINAVKVNYAANPEPTRQRAKLWAEANKERVKQVKRAQYAANAPEIKKRAKEWASANPERRAEIAQASAKKNRLKKCAQGRKRLQALKIQDPDRFKEENRMRAAIRRTRERRNGINIDRESWSAIINLFGITCIYCKTSGHKLVMDHFMPVALGGKTEPGNLIPCCPSCNGKKGAMHPDKWLETIGAADDVPIEGSITIMQFLQVSRQALHPAVKIVEV